MKSSRSRQIEQTPSSAQPPTPSAEAGPWDAAKYGNAAQQDAIGGSMSGEEARLQEEQQRSMLARMEAQERARQEEQRRWEEEQRMRYEAEQEERAREARAEADARAEHDDREWQARQRMRADAEGPDVDPAGVAASLGESALDLGEGLLRGGAEAGAGITGVLAAPAMKLPFVGDGLEYGANAATGAIDDSLGTDTRGAMDLGRDVGDVTNKAGKAIAKRVPGAGTAFKVAEAGLDQGRMLEHGVEWVTERDVITQEEISRDESEEAMKQVAFRQATRLPLVGKRIKMAGAGKDWAEMNSGEDEDTPKRRAEVIIDLLDGAAP